MGLLQNLTGMHAVVILAVVLLLFGAGRLPALARGAGQAIRAFRSEVRDDSAEDLDPDGVRRRRSDDATA